MSRPKCIRRYIPRFCFLRKITLSTQIHRSRLGQIHIDITTVIIGTVGHIRAVLRTLVLLIGRLLVRHAQTEEVTGHATSTPRVHVISLLQRIPVQDFITPFHVRIKVRIQLVFNQVQRHRRIQFFFPTGQPGLVGQHGVVVCPKILRHFLQMGYREVDTPRNRQFVCRTALRRDQYDTVRSPRSIHGRGRSILQNGETLDIRRVYLAQVTLQTVYQHQSTLVGSERADAANPEVRDVLSRLTTGLQRNDTRHAAAQHIGDGSGRYLKILHIHCGYRPHKADFTL